MKSKIVCFITVLLIIAFSVKSQQAIPADAEAFYHKAISSINPRHSTWVKQTAQMVNKQNLDEAFVRRLSTGYATQNNLGNMDIEALVVLVMMQVAKDNEQDMKNMMADMKKKNEEKQKLREAQEMMEKSKSEMKRAMLDSFRLLTKPQINTISASQTQIQTARLQTNTSVNQINRPVNAQISQTETQVSAAEIKQVQDSLKLKLDDMNEMSEMTSLRLQMMMDRRSKSMSTLSNIMKKISETQDSIIQNMK
jgi:hypothetical protein